MADQSFGEGLTLLESRTRLVVMAIWAVIGFSFAASVCQALEAVGAINIETSDPTIALAIAFAYFGSVAAFIISVIVVGMWIHRAHANLFAAGLDDLDYTPGWSVGWFFIPIMNLVKPFQAMRELWNASHGADRAFSQDTPGILGVWWGAWIIGNILDHIAMRIQLNVTEGTGLAASNWLGAGGSALTVVSAWMLLNIVKEVMTAQRNHLQVSAAFG